jgi:predicted amidophosphoribosyltransferase
MALINCPECNSKLSEYADLCLKCGLPRQKFAMVQAEKVRLKRPVTTDESFSAQNISSNATANLCPECGTKMGFLPKGVGLKCPECTPPLPGHEGFWEQYEESKRLAKVKIDQWEESEGKKH